MQSSWAMLLTASAVALSCINAGSVEPNSASAPVAGSKVNDASLVDDVPQSPPRCEIVPLPEHQAAFMNDGSERLRWHFGPQYPRPFFYPFLGPSGASLTRMGHPGAENHDHHRSIWFAHQDVAGVNFWTDRTEARIRQKHWYVYDDGEQEALLAAALGWYDGAGKLLMDQDVVAVQRPLAEGEQTLELQLTLRPPPSVKTVALGKTNFGILSVRVAKSISVHFGGGTLADSEGRRGEAEIFGKQARRLDYSGNVAVGRGDERRYVVEGITFFDHPANPRYPTHWHVREDGWMGASFCMQEGYVIEAEKPLRLRYLLHAHRGAYDDARAETVQRAFAERSGFTIAKSSRKHRQYEVQREPSTAAR